MRNDIDERERADDVRVLLETAHVPPPRVDIARAVESGVRVRRRRWYAAAGGVTALAMVGTVAVTQALGSPLAQGPDGVDTLVGDAPKPYSSCTVRTLSTPDGEDFAGYAAADPTGRYVVGGVTGADGDIRPVLWTDGEPEVLRVRAQSAEARDVNAAGVVVGSATAADGREFAWLYRDGKVSELDGAGLAGSVVARAITERGDVLGEVWTAKQATTLLWKGGDPEAVVPLRVDGDATARDMDENGTLVGGTQNDAVGKPGTPMVWAVDGEPKALDVPEGFTGGQATGVRGGWAVGWVSRPAAEVTPPAGADAVGSVRQSHTFVPARWELATGAVTVWPERAGPAESVNTAGWVVLTSLPDGGPAAVFRDGELYELSGSKAGAPATISDDGRRLYGTPTSTDRAGLELLAWSC